MREPFSYRSDPAVPKFPDDRPIIVFDGHCAMCSNWARFVLRHDANGVYRLLPAQSSLGRALYRRPRNEYVISTKIGRVLRRPLGPNAIKDQWLGGLEFQTVFDYGYDGVMRSFEDSLQRLGVNRVDVLLIHDLDPWDHNPATLNAYFTQLKTSGWKALAELREAGVIGGIRFVAVSGSALRARLALTIKAFLFCDI